jgi:predicted ATP-dependent endonuclease of OLD family
VALTKLKVHGYRGFAREGVLTFATPNKKDDGSGLTVITGPNNAGKSSILEALRARAGNQSASFTQGTRNEAIQSVSIEYTIDEKIETIKSITTGSSETKKEGANTDMKVFVLPSRRAFNPYFGKASWTRDDFLINSPLPSQRSSSLSGFEYRLFHILEAPGSFNDLLKSILGFEPKWTVDQSDQGQYFLKFFSGGKSHSSDGMGEGIISVFAIADALYDSQPGEMVVIDEPELSLHPALQRRLSRVLASYAKDRQIVISTHSPYFVNLEAIAVGSTLARVITGPTGTVIHQLSSAGKNAIKHLTAPNLNNPHILGLDAKELFFQEDGVLLTEGQEDVVLYPKVFEQLSIQMPAKIFGWGAGGAGNIKHLCQILNDLGFAKVGALFDNDKAADQQEGKDRFPGYVFELIPAKDVRTKPATPDKQAVKGLLDDSYQLRAELRGAASVVMARLVDYFKPPQTDI